METLVPRLVEIGLLIFCGMFALVIIYTFRRRNQGTFERAAHMPLHDDEPRDELKV